MKKKNARTATILGLAGALVAGAVGLSAGDSRAERASRRPPVVAPQQKDSKIQIAILLDTSSSMNGLIDQAKSQLWKIVNQAGVAEKQGKRPRVEIALYEYGKSSLSAEGSWIRQILPFTTDLDRVSEELFALQTNGGEEYCGMVIHRALSDLQWSSSQNDLKLIYIAGNEPFTQGPFDYHKAIAEAKQKGVVVNTIHCGGEEPTWKDAALIAGGDFLRIDQNKVVAYVPSPQDDEIRRLNADLNKTYIGYGMRGREGAARQMEQDKNAEGAMGGAGVARAAAKASASYDNSTWDIVDGTKKGDVDLGKMKAEELPPEMQKMSVDERKAFVGKVSAERTRIQTRIAELSKEREKFVGAELAKKGGPKDTLDAVMAESVRAQAVKAGFEMK
jgi:von Willebrand factor type A domain-containing protein